MRCLVRPVLQCTNWVAECLALLGKYTKTLHPAWSHCRAEDVSEEASNVWGADLCENHFTVVAVPSSHSSLSTTLLEMYSSSITYHMNQVFLKACFLNKYDECEMWYPRMLA